MSTGGDARATVQPPPTTTVAATAVAAVPEPRGTVAGGGGGGGTVYGGHPADNHCTGSDADSIVRTPVGRGTRGYPQDIASYARAPTETRIGQSATGVGIGLVTPVPHRPVSQRWVSVLDVHGSNSPPGGNMAVVVEPPTTVAATAAIPVAPGAGSRSPEAGVGDARGGGNGGGGGGDGGGGGGGGGSGGDGDGGGARNGGRGGGDDSSGNVGIEQARLRTPPGFEGVARTRAATVGSHQGGIRRRIQEIPLPTTENALGNTAGATVYRVPRHGDFFPARECDAMRERVVAEQRLQLLRQSARLQRQRVRLQLQEAELELQREHMVHQRVQLRRQRLSRAQRQVPGATPLVFWGPGGLLMPIS